MKFAEYLSTHITPEWRKQYINYERMKDLLYDAVEEYTTLSSNSAEDPIGSNFYENFEKQWFQYCDEELNKINIFFNEKLTEAKVRFTKLQEDLRTIQVQEEFHHNHRASVVDEEIRKRHRRKPKPWLKFLKPKPGQKICKITDLKLAFSEYYLSLILIQNYQKLNFTGFRKIQKKHDKLLETSSGAKWRETYVNCANFYKNKENDKLIQQTESIVINILENGDRPKAMRRLRVPPAGMKQNPWITFKVGLCLGAFIILAVVVLLTALFHPDRGTRDYRLVLRLFRGPFLLILFIFFLSINVYGWRSSGVNHVLIFELDPRNHLSELHLMEMAGVFSIIWILGVLGFLYSNELTIPPYSFPLGLIILFLIFFLNPTKSFHHDARFWFLRVLCRIVAAPFYYVGFADFWLADQLNSITQVLIDFLYIICFYASSQGNFDFVREDTGNAYDATRCVDETWLIRAFVAVMPAWFRFMQCLRRYRDSKEAFPHLVNAGKYSTTFFVMAFSTLYHQGKNQIIEDEDRDGDNSGFNIFLILWIISAIISSCYAYIWDLKMDWGLFASDAGENKWLRKEIVYPKWSYYFGIVEDLILRFGWVLSMSLTELDYMNSDILVSILTPLELFRRFVWNFFRLENEHLNNCGKFRAVRDISIASLHASDHKPVPLSVKIKPIENIL